MTATMLTALVSASIAQGSATVWFQYAGSSGGVGAYSQGPGQTLVIETAGFGFFDLEIEMWANLTGVPLYSVNTTLSADTNSLITTMSMNPPADGGIETPAGNLNTPGPGDIATNFGGATFFGTGYTGNNLLLGTFTLRAVRNESSDPTNIYARVGNGLWAQSDSQPADVRFAAGELESGGTVGAAKAVAITVYYGVPEPGSIALLVTGALCLLNRRRRAKN
ncbi:MAG: PEP-CTERM sorting domain-containing protein [Phycisphaerales bacterium]|nr:PEP-CTERM sorting domain-containing protein [Phycisphaerales bacterium]